MITIELTGSNTASALGVTHSEKTKGPIGPLCRKLIAAGLATDEDTVLVVRGTTPVFRERSIVWFSGYSVTESYEAVRRRKFTPRTLI